MAGLADAARAKAIQSMWTDLCTVTVKKRVTDAETHISSFTDEILLEDEPCKLSFSSTTPTAGDDTQSITQTVKLFVANAVAIPAGSRVTITRDGKSLEYKSSGEPSIFTYHQELSLNTVKERA